MQTWVQSYQLSPGSTVRIEQEAGAVFVRGWEQPEVNVTATTAGTDPVEDRLLVYEDGHALRLEVRRPRGLLLGFLSTDPGIDLEVAVPVGTHLEIETGSGPVEVTAILGVVRVNSGSGKVATRRIAGDLQIETGSGSLSVADVEGTIELETGSGSVSVDRVRGKLLRLETGGGTVRLTQIDVRDLELESGSGPIQVELVRIHPGGSYEIEAGSGGVTVALPKDAGFDVRLEAHSGRISYGGIDLRVTHSEQGEVAGIVGGGGAELSIETGSGGITLKPYEGPAAHPPAPPAPPRDAALENSEQLQRILQMVEQGKLTAEEAEALLRALDEEEAPA